MIGSLSDIRRLGARPPGVEHRELEPGDSGEWRSYRRPVRRVVAQLASHVCRRSFLGSKRYEERHLGLASAEDERAAINR